MARRDQQKDQKKASMKRSLKDMTLEELKGFFSEKGEKPFRAVQVFERLAAGATHYSEMTGLPKALRDQLEEETDVMTLAVRQVLQSKLDETRKYIFSTRDGYRIETVYMKYHYGSTVCISSQAGCRMGCRFCASARAGLERNLTAAEMMDQVLLAARDTREKISRIVIMGTGEPFDNYENVQRFLLNVTAEKGGGLSRRNITVSTCGVVPGINRFAADFPQVNLAISLHGPTDVVRSRTMPVNRAWGVDALLKAARDYVEKTGRRITFEYALIRGANDEEKHAAVLAKKLRGLNCHVNLISLNEVKETGLSGSEKKQVLKFQRILEAAGIQVTVRRELGSDIHAACGQLRLEKRQQAKPEEG